MASPIAARSWKPKDWSRRCRLFYVVFWLAMMFAAPAITEFQSNISAPVSEPGSFTFSLDLQCKNASEAYGLSPPIQNLESWLIQQLNWGPWQGNLNIFAFGCESQPVMGLGWWIFLGVAIGCIGTGIYFLKGSHFHMMLAIAICSTFWFCTTGLPLFRSTIADGQICKPFVSRINEFNDTILYVSVSVSVFKNIGSWISFFFVWQGTNCRCNIIGVLGHADRSSRLVQRLCYFHVLWWFYIARIRKSQTVIYHPNKDKSNFAGRNSQEKHDYFCSSTGRVAACVCIGNVAVHYRIKSFLCTSRFRAIQLNPRKIKWYCMSV